MEREILIAPVTADEFATAEEKAQAKLERIIEREGDAGGARRTQSYLNALIVEIIGQERYTAYTASLAQGYKKEADAKRQPKEKICYLTPIIAQIS